MVKRLSPVFLLAVSFGLLMTGCATTDITNLTPRYEPRNAAGLYPVEAAMKSQQQTLRWNTIRPQAIVDTEAYPMRPTLLMTNRWETLVPVPPGKSVVYFRFKFDFDYNDFGSAGRSDSKLSPTYRLEILDK
jgi:hypothetical protein